MHVAGLGELERNVRIGPVVPLNPASTNGLPSSTQIRGIARQRKIKKRVPVRKNRGS